MGKPKLMRKIEFCNTNSIDIFCQCLINGKVKLNGIFYSISNIDDDIILRSSIDENRPIDWLKDNAKTFNINISKYDTNFNKIVTNHIKNNNNAWIKDNYFDVLTSLLINKNGINFEIISSDNTKEVKLYVYSISIYKEITAIILKRIKSKFSEILINDEFQDLVQDIEYSDLEMLFELTKGEFLNKAYKKEFIKFFISIVATKGFGQKFKSYRNQGVICYLFIKEDNHYLCSYFDYHDETLFMKIGFTKELIGLSFENNKIKIVIQDKLSNFAIESIKKCDGVLKEYL